MQKWEPRRVRRARRNRERLIRVLRALGAAALALILSYGAFRLITYGIDTLRSLRAGERMKEVYHASVPLPAGTGTGIVQDWDAPTAVPVPAAQTSVPETAAAAEAEALPAPARSSLPEAFAAGDGGLEALRQENPDVIGWLTVGGLLEEAVVQRDNVYYLDHDASGQSSSAGAIFMDSSVLLADGPSALVLYGHNMKNGTRFGGLRNYENPAFYLRNPFITFDTVYGRREYVVFSVSRVGMEEGESGYLDFFDLFSEAPGVRERVIETLIAASVHPPAVDALPGDPLLLLVTCLDGDSVRRVIAARALRPGEDPEALRLRIACLGQGEQTQDP